MRSLLLSIILFLSLAVSAQIIPNKGQWAQNILYRSDVPNGVLFFENDKLTYNFTHPEDIKKLHGHAARIMPEDATMRYHSFQMQFLNANPHSKKKGLLPSEEKLNYFLGNDKSKWVSNISAFHKVSYSEIYKGIDVVFYSETNKIKYDFVVHAGANINDIRLRFPGADKISLTNNELKIKLSFTDIVEQIPIAYQLVKGRKVTVPCYFVLEKGMLTFKVGKGYQKEYDLVIDPLLVFSTYSGSTSDNFGYTATYDEDGFLYAGSSSFNTGYPTTIGAYDATFNSNPTSGAEWVFIPGYGAYFAGFGVPDIAITKYDTSGTKRIYSTYIGGVQCEVPHSLVVNSKGELIIYGTTGSQNFPVTANAYDTVFNGGSKANLSMGISVNYQFGSDIIISKLSADGSQLLSSTYFGGDQNDGLNLYLSYNYADQMRGEVVLDKNDDIYIATCSYSAGLATGGSFQNSLNGLQDGLIAKFPSDLSTLTWASYIGGSNREAVYSIVLDKNENLIVAGGTISNDLPTTAGVIFPTYQGAPSDGFIAKISNDGTLLNTLTYFGTSKYDQVYFVKIDKFDNIFVYGQSASMDSTLIKNAQYYSVKSGMFVSKLSNDLKSFIWSTTFGTGDGRINLSPTAFMVDLCSKVYLTGWGSPDDGFEYIPNYLVDPTGNTGHNGGRGTDGLAVTPDAFQSTTDGDDFYIMVLEDDASALSYGSFFGGNKSHEHVDGGTSRFDRKGKIYQSMCAGCGKNSDMPIFPANAVSPTNNSNNCNNGLFKMDFLLPNVVADFKTSPACATQNFQFKNTSVLQSNTSYHWDFGDGDTSVLSNPQHIFQVPGTYDVRLVLNDPTACNLTDTIVKKIQVYQTPPVLLQDINACSNSIAQLGMAPIADPAIVYRWIPGESVSDSSIANPTTLSSQTQQFKLVITNGPCIDTFQQRVIVQELDFKISDSTFCNQSDSNIDLTVLTLKGKVASYVWSSNPQYSDTLNTSITDSIFIYTANNGVTSLYLNLRDSIGCMYSDTLNIYKSQPEIFRNQALCPGIATSIGPSLYYGNIQYNWFPGQWLTDSTIANPVASPMATIDYTLLISIAGVCIDTLIESFVIPDIVIDAKGDTVYCNSAVLTSSAWVDVKKGKATQFIWSSNNLFSDTLNTDLLSSVVSLPLTSNRNKFYVKELDSTGCVVNDSIVISKQILSADIPAQQSFCQGDTLRLTVSSSQWAPGLQVSWMDTADIAGAANMQSIELKNVPGNVSVFVQLTDSLGCKASDTAQIYISDLYPSAIKAWSDKDTILKGSSTVLHVQPNGHQYLWLPFESLNDPTKQHPIASPENATTYQVTLTDPGDLNCTFKTGVTVNVYEPECAKDDVYVPNIFTPNGDGKNDVLYVRGNNITELYFTIYDRWGEPVFETNDQTVGWKGDYKTQSNDPAVFAYYLTVKCAGGNEYFEKGNITVMR